MTEILNPLFHENPKFNDEHSFLLLEKYMFTVKNTHSNQNKTIDIIKPSIQHELKNRSDNNNSPNIFSSERPESALITEMHYNLDKKNFINQLPEKNMMLSVHPTIPQGVKLIIDTSDWSQPVQYTAEKQYFKPKQRDTLFWCMFIAMYGHDEYTFIKNHHGNRELEEKQKILDYFRKSPFKIKDANIKITKVRFQEMISELMIDKQVGLSYIILFCLFYNINIIVVKDKTYIEYGSNDIIDNAECFIFNRNIDKDYEIDLNTTPDKVKFIRENLFKKENETKTLKGASAYTINELKDILKKIDANSETILSGKPTKTDIYNTILVKCMW